MPNLVATTDPNFIPPMDRVVHSEPIQYNRVGSKDLNVTDMNRNSIYKGNRYRSDGSHRYSSLYTNYM